ncbi:hypothetical protein ACIBI4_33955 [Streptomyces sp. NPDC050418]|uniref:hypothetical protein n=1 Tax=Streptomyces sp. NPDC050418 TaxID=3365612 RepID=UPI0037B56052
MDTKSHYAHAFTACTGILALGAALLAFAPAEARSTAVPIGGPSETQLVAQADDVAVLGKGTGDLDGLKIKPSVPRPWTPADTGAGSDNFNYLVTVEFTNKGDKSVDLGDVMTEVNTDGGATNKIVDSVNDVGMSPSAGRLAPNQTSTLKYGFSSESKPTYVNFDFKPLLGDDAA